MRPNRGFSLPEVLVASFLMIVVLGLVAQLFLPSLILQQREMASSAGQQAAWVFIHRLRQGLLNTFPETVTICDAPATLSYQPLADSGAPFSATSGAPLLGDHFVILTYDPTAMVIWEKPRHPSAYDFSDNTRPLRMKPDDLQTLLATSDPDDRIVARYVKGLQFKSASSSSDVIALPIVADMRFAIEVARGGGKRVDETWELTTSFSCRNMRW